MQKTPALLGGLGAAAVLGLILVNAGWSPPACWTAVITVLCAVWWVTEAIPMAATALIPLAAFPLTGVLSHSKVAASYGHTLVLMIAAGSMVASALEKSGAHRRVAVGLIRAVGGECPRRLLLGFMVASAGLSMWLANAATTLMLLPVAMAILESNSSPKLSGRLLLGIAYASSIGGNGTPIGTPPNLICIGTYATATGKQISFTDWMSFGIPSVLVMLPIVWLWLSRGLETRGAFAIPKLSPWRTEERRVLIVFALTALAWMTRAGPFGGWAGLLGVADSVGDSTVAVAAAVLLFALPNGDADGGRLLDWETAVQIPWGILLLVGGGLAIGQAFHASGLDRSLGQLLEPLTQLPTLLMILVACLAGTFLTEFTSNTATANVALPVLAATADAIGVDPLLLLVPTTLAVNCAFMLPVATLPNAIVYGTGKIDVREMFREGFVLNLIASIVLTVVSYVLLGGR